MVQHDDIVFIHRVDLVAALNIAAKVADNDQMPITAERHREQARRCEHAALVIIDNLKGA